MTSFRAFTDNMECDVPQVKQAWPLSADLRCAKSQASSRQADGPEAFGLDQNACPVVDLTDKSLDVPVLHLAWLKLESFRARPGGVGQPR